MYYFKAELTSMFYFLTRGRKNGSSGLSYQALKQSFHIERQVNHSGSLQSVLDKNDGYLSGSFLGGKNFTRFHADHIKREGVPPGSHRNLLEGPKTSPPVHEYRPQDTSGIHMDEYDSMLMSGNSCETILSMDPIIMFKLRRCFTW